MNTACFDPNRVRLCVVGSFGYNDIGDEAMLTEDLDYLLNDLRIPPGNITLLGGQRSEYTASYHQHPLERCLSTDTVVRLAQPASLSVRARIRAAARRLLKGPPYPDEPAVSEAARSCDALLVTGGGTINTRDAQSGSLRRTHSIVTYFWKLGKPIYMSGQTIGPLGIYREHDDLAREIVRAVDVLTVRDHRYSRRYLELLGCTPRELVETADDAAALPYETAVLPKEVEQFLDRGPTAAVNLTLYTADTDAKRFLLASLCEHLIRAHGLQVLLLGNTPWDVSTLWTVFDLLDDALKERVAVPDTSAWRAGQLKRAISRCRLAFGGRYHFVVFAATANVPVVGHCGNHYSYIKQDGFARPVGLERFILNERASCDRESIQARLADALQYKPSLEGRFKRPGESMLRFGQWLQSLPRTGRY